MVATRPSGSLDGDQDRGCRRLFQNSSALDCEREAPDRGRDAVIWPIARIACSAAWLNTNQLFYWRKQYLTGQLSEAPITERSGSVHILPISVKDDEPLTADQEQIKTLAPRLTMNIEIPGRALVSLEGALDATFIRTLLEGLRG